MFNIGVLPNLNQGKQYSQETNDRKARLYNIPINPNPKVVDMNEIEKEYLSTEFIYGNNPKYTVIKRKRIEHAGDFELRMDIKNGIIKDIEILGDFLITGDINESIKNRLKNVKLDKECIEKALPEQLDDVIMNLNKNEFINIIIN